ncbi:unnamed protein product [Rhodiola kirilowii]
MEDVQCFIGDNVDTKSNNSSSSVRRQPVDEILDTILF